VPFDSTLSPLLLRERLLLAGLAALLTGRISALTRAGH
jgi:hypothetical protein